jgi:cell division septum initiation protein DivIVA
MERNARVLALKTEASRLKERLDTMQRQIEGDQDAWWHITTNLPESVAEVVVDKVLAEARQTALALATVVKTLDALEVGKDQTPANPVVDPADEVKAARERKLESARARAAAQS